MDIEAVTVDLMWIWYGKVEVRGWIGSGVGSGERGMGGRVFGGRIEKGWEE